MKLATFAAAAVIAATSADAEEQVYQRHCTQADYFPPGMSCKGTYAGGTRCESGDRTVWIGENTFAQSQPERASPKCTINILHKTNPPCVVDPAGNEPTCNHEARMAVAKRHGFEDMAHVTMSRTISGNESFEREFDKVYDACMAKNHYCIYRNGQLTR